METFERIEMLCRRHGISITALESEIGFSRGSIGKMKKGHMPTPERLQKIASRFNVTVDYLLTGREPAEDPAEDPAAAQEPRYSRAVWELLCEAEKAPAADVEAATALLKRINAYRAAFEESKKG